LAMVVERVLMMRLKLPNMFLDYIISKNEIPKGNRRKDCET
jgi:hypothetical protein